MSFANTYRVRVTRTQTLVLELSTTGDAEDAKDSAVVSAGEDYPADWWDTVSIEADIITAVAEDLR